MSQIIFKKTVKNRNKQFKLKKRSPKRLAFRQQVIKLIRAYGECLGI